MTWLLLGLVIVSLAAVVVGDLKEAELREFERANAVARASVHRAEALALLCVDGNLIELSRGRGAARGGAGQRGRRRSRRERAARWSS